LLAQRFAGRTFLETSLSTEGESQNVTAFAATGPGHRWAAALFNKTPEPVSIGVEGLPHAGYVSRLRLLAPAIDSRDGVTFGGQPIQPGSNFSPQPEPGPVFSRGSLIEQLPAYSAVVLES
jgi:hypothetical protein